jgi:hypothetical protein
MVGYHGRKDGERLMDHMERIAMERDDEYERKYAIRYDDTDFCFICDEEKPVASMVYDRVYLPDPEYQDVAVYRLLCTRCYTEKHYGHPPVQEEQASLVQGDGDVDSGQRMEQTE